MAKALVIITSGLIILILSYFLVYPKYKEREIQSDFEAIARQRLEDLKSDEPIRPEKCKRDKSGFFDPPRFDPPPIFSLFIEHSDKYFIEVRKTDSLTSPYVAVARYPYTVKHYYSTLSEEDCLKSPKSIENKETVLTFAYQNDKWVETTK
jgi:hypothetical protein